jgi:3,4-dihydroxy 2-butanone 4-phosphate synthase / GTP cyclohydrolase II
VNGGQVQSSGGSPGGSSGGFEAIERALVDLKAGKAVVVIDDEDRENEGDLIFAAEMATPELVSFMVRYTSGYICVALTETECDRLDLPPMHHTNTDNFRTAFTVTVDAKEGVTTGISASDRAHTIRLLADPAAVAGDLVRPGHVLPLRAREGGVLRRPGHRPRWTSRGWPGSRRPVRSARSCRRRTRARWPAATSSPCSRATTSSR